MGALSKHNRTFTVANGATTGSVELEDWDTLGLLVPTIDSGTWKLQVSDDNSNWFDVYDGNGIQVLSWTASTGARAVSTRDMADVVGYRYLKVVLGASQTAERTFTLTFKAPKRR